METMQSKPRLTYAEFLSQRNPFTVAAILERYIVEMNGCAGTRGLKPLGSTHLYALRMLQRLPIAQKDARKLTIADWKDHCNARIQTVCAATVNQDITYLRSPLEYARSAWADCTEVSAKSLDKAMPVLKKYNLIGKGRPRSRRPSPDELARLLEYFKERDQRSKIPMVALTEFALWSARRRGEITRLCWSDINHEKRTCIVRDMKDPKHKKGNDHEFPLLGRAWDIVMAQPRRDGEDRIFPFNSVSVGACYTRAKKELGIENLRYHDNRREAASRLFEAGFSVQEVMLVTGHKTPIMLLRVYTKLKAEDLHMGPAAKRGMESKFHVPMTAQAHDILQRATTESANLLA